MRQIWTTTCWCISGIFAYMLWFEDGVFGGFWAGDDFVEGLLSFIEENPKYISLVEGIFRRIDSGVLGATGVLMGF